MIQRQSGLDYHRLQQGPQTPPRGPRFIACQLLLGLVFCSCIEVQYHLRHHATLTLVNVCFKIIVVNIPKDTMKCTYVSRQTTLYMMSTLNTTQRVQ